MSSKILIIEDNDDFRFLLKSCLETQALGVNILEATSGEQGKEMALAETPDIILMDIRLPGINGVEAASAIKQEIPDTKIVILTMFETETFKKVFSSDYIEAYIGKSEIHDKLIPLIKKVLSEGKASEFSGPNPKANSNPNPKAKRTGY
ncbi:MAG: response regulator transcription factor [Candidatus Omnitrophica bacterium]|nr:response regulator transcription factor [Candidatus Omnitrophota bacterium]